MLYGSPRPAGQRFREYIEERIDAEITSTQFPDRLQPVVNPLVDARLATDDAPAQAAALAVDAEIANRDLLEGGTILEDDIAGAVVDENDRATWAIWMKDGSLHPYTRDTFADAFAGTFLRSEEVDTEITGVSVAIVDDDDRRTWIEADAAGRPTAYAATAIAEALSGFGGMQVFNVQAYGATGDGVTNDTSAVLAARAAAIAAGGGVLYFPAGRYRLTAAIVAASRLSIVGDGMGLSILAPEGNINAIEYTVSSTITPIEDVVYAGFAIDGSAQTAVTYNAEKTKGVFILGMRRATFRDVYVYDTGATGIGVDFLQDTVIDHCIADGCGRLNDGTQAGGSGIGVGTARLDVGKEDVRVVHCTATDNAVYGIFIESQNSSSSIGAVIAHNYVAGNKVGIGDSGGEGALITGNTVIANEIGIGIDSGSYQPGIPGRYARVRDNYVIANTSHGILLSNAETGEQIIFPHVVDNTIRQNGGAGIAVEIGADGNISALIIRVNTITSNQGAGIHLWYAGSATPTVSHLRLIGNEIASNGVDTLAAARDGIHIAVNTYDLLMEQNHTWNIGGFASQQRGAVLASGFSHDGARITGNGFDHNVMPDGLLIDGTLTGTANRIRDNAGYNPQGPQPVTVTASPMTITAGPTPEVLYLHGGTVSSVTKGGVPMSTSGGIALSPYESIAVTYTAAPTITRDRR